MSDLISSLEFPVKNFMGGNIVNRLKEWLFLTSDKNILDIVKGVKLDFLNWPVQEKIPRPYRMNQEQSGFIDSELRILLEKSIIERVETPEGQYVSNIFLRPKPNNKFRMIIDLSMLNNDIEKQHFKMQHLEVAIDMLTRGCFLASIDLKDAYYSVPINPQFRKFLCFQWKGRFFRFLAMPFGPSTFHKIVGPSL